MIWCSCSHNSWIVVSIVSYLLTCKRWTRLTSTWYDAVARLLRSSGSVELKIYQTFFSFIKVALNSISDRLLQWHKKGWCQMFVHWWPLQWSTTKVQCSGAVVSAFCGPISCPLEQGKSYDPNTSNLLCQIVSLLTIQFILGSWWMVSNGEHWRFNNSN